MNSFKSKFYFRSHENGHNISQKSIVGGIASITSQFIQFILQMIGTIVLARLLTPYDFGIIGMVTVVINFVKLFKSTELSMATIQREKINHDQISTLFWINILISSSLGILILAISPLIARFYNKPELIGVNALLAFSFILTGLTVQHQALLKRNMRFRTLAIITICSQIMYLIIAIIMAVLKFKYWALVGGILTSAATTTILTIIFCPWIPGRIKRKTSIREMLFFGGHVMGFNFVNYFSRNIDYILIGKFIGAEELGFYSKAYKLFLEPINKVRTPINNVAIPTLCKIRSEFNRYKKYYKIIIFLIALLTMPIMSIMMVYADNIIIIILGEQWRKSICIFRILALVGFLQATIQAGRALPLISMGFSRRYLHFGIIQAFITVLGIIIGIKWGIKGVAIGYGISFYLLVPFTLVWCLKGSPVNITDWLNSIWCPLFAAIIMMFICLWVKNILEKNVNIYEISMFLNLKLLFIGSISGLIVFALILFSLPTSRRYCFSIYMQLKILIKNHKLI